MRRILTLLSLLIFCACAQEEPAPAELTDFIPENAAIILQLEQPDLFFSNLRNNEFIQQNLDHDLVNDLEKKLSFLKYFPHENPGLLILSTSKNGNLDATFLTAAPVEVETLDSIQNKQVETLTSSDWEMEKYTLESSVGFTAVKEGVFISGSSAEAVENAIFAAEDPISSVDYEKVWKAASPRQPSIFVNHKQLGAFKKYFSGSAISELANFSHWTVLDAQLDPQAVRLNGITTAEDTAFAKLNLFRGVEPVENKIPEITPLSAEKFLSISFSSFGNLLQNLQAFQKTETSEETSAENDLLESASEVGIIYLKEAPVFVVRVPDAETSKMIFPAQNAALEDFRGFQIFEYSEERSFAEILNPLLNPEDLQVYSVFDNYFLFSSSAEAVKKVISAAQNEQVLATSEAFKTASENLSTASSLLLVRNNRNAPNENSNISLENHPLTALQLIFQDDYAHVHAVLAKSSAAAPQQDVAQETVVTLDAEVATKPFFFTNHRTNGKDVAVQDVENVLYLISPSGEIYWKKKLDSRILGEIHSVDILRNGRYQLAFATQGKVHVIDREGNSVKPFPLEFNDPITQPLAVFDYDKKRDYRFLVVQDDEVLMYDRRGKRVRGFKFSEANDRILQPPKHIRIGRKDYIVIADASGKLHILSRTGETRVPVREKIDYSENEWYEYNGNFVLTNTSGGLLKISEEGKISEENIGLADNHNIAATEKTLVTLSENQLTIKGKPVTLDFGIYTPPQIFVVNDKIYVSVTDAQTHKVYLFDSNAELLPGFPVYGNSAIDLSNADGDSAPELVVQGDQNSILIYQL